MRDIVHIGDPVLRENSKAVPTEEIRSAHVQGIIQDMKNALKREKFGVAIAAPQVGVALRIFIVGGPVFASREHNDYTAETYPDQIFINPEILKVSRKTKIGDEGCLSVPGKYGSKVLRNEKVSVSYYDELGIKTERGASSFLARVFQHEIDHLNGVLYVDEAIEVIDVDEELKPINT
ncbi:MAG: peptide deformylase [Candidatus Pacebacteria bacterium]|nr:peptide deformylase [Candidatus Paceibacterota bacterium]